MKTRAKILLIILIIIIGCFESDIVLANQSYYDCDRKKSEPVVYTLACNIYHEARGESLAGKLAVAFVTLNRVKSSKYPNNVYDVVWQKHQFSWTNDGKSDKVYDKESWFDAIHKANFVLNVQEKDYSYIDITEGSMYYHTHKVKPKWVRNKNPTVVIDNHLFYNNIE